MAHHWMSDATESCFPSHGHKGVSHSWLQDAQQIGYIHFLQTTPPKLRQPPKTHTHLKGIVVKAPRQRSIEEKWKGARSETTQVQLLDGAVLISGKRCNFPIYKDYILK